MAKTMTLNDFPPYLQATIQAIANVFFNGDIDTALARYNEISERKIPQQDAEEYEAEIRLRFSQH